MNSGGCIQLFPDILTGVFYLCWIPVPTGLRRAISSIRIRMPFFRFALTFLLVKLLGFIIYYAYPRPPGMCSIWVNSNPHTPAITAGWDALTICCTFRSLPACTPRSNVFASMPSLHASYPLIVIVLRHPYTTGWINLLSGTIMVGICSLQYNSSHHYVLDCWRGLSVDFQASCCSIPCMGKVGGFPQVGRSFALSS